MSNTDALTNKSVKLNALEKYIITNCNLQFKQHNAPRLWISGKPGIGKSDLMYQVCKKNGWRLVAKYMSNLSLEQITGIPVQISSGEVAKWSKSELFSFENPTYEPEDVDESTPTILFLDDCHLADKMIQKYLFQILTYKSLNSYKLSKNTAIILAGNRQSDRAGAQPILAPNCNRVMFMETCCDVNDWIANFAIKHGVRPDIISYLETKPTDLSSDPLDSAAWSSPRSWTYFSDMLNEFGEDASDENIINVAKGLICPSAVKDFMCYKLLYSKWDCKKIMGMKEDDIKYQYLEKIVKGDMIEAFTFVHSIGAYVCSYHNKNGEGKIFSELCSKYYNISKYLIENMSSCRTFVLKSLRYIRDYEKGMNNGGFLPNGIFSEIRNCIRKDPNSRIFIEQISTICSIN